MYTKTVILPCSITIECDSAGKIDIPGLTHTEARGNAIFKFTVPGKDTMITPENDTGENFGNLDWLRLSAFLSELEVALFKHCMISTDDIAYIIDGAMKFITVGMVKDGLRAAVKNKEISEYDDDMINKIYDQFVNVSKETKFAFNPEPMNMHLL